MIRKATKSDAEAIAIIYNQSIGPDNISNCEFYPVNVQTLISQIQDRGDRYPTFIYETALHELAGWAMIKPFSIRPHLVETVELAVYVHKAFMHKGSVAAKLFIHILSQAKALGYKTAIAIILEHNSASRRGVLALGFKHMVALNEVACRDGHWINIHWYQKDLLLYGAERITKRIQASNGKLTNPIQH